MEDKGKRKDCTAMHLYRPVNIRRVPGPFMQYPPLPSECIARSEESLLVLGPAASSAQRFADLDSSVLLITGAFREAATFPCLTDSARQGHGLNTLKAAKSQQRGKPAKETSDSTSIAESHEAHGFRRCFSGEIVTHQPRPVLSGGRGWFDVISVVRCCEALLSAVLVLGETHLAFSGTCIKCSTILYYDSIYIYIYNIL